jgi:hypothetical protein
MEVFLEMISDVDSGTTMISVTSATGIDSAEVTLGTAEEGGGVPSVLLPLLIEIVLTTGTRRESVAVTW